LLPSAQARSQRRRREGQMFSARQSDARSAKQHAPPSVQHDRVDLCTRYAYREK
jgi:hypothetical protein